MIKELPEIVPGVIGPDPPEQEPVAPHGKPPVTAGVRVTELPLQIVLLAGVKEIARSSTVTTEDAVAVQIPSVAVTVYVVDVVGLTVMVDPVLPFDQANVPQVKNVKIALLLNAEPVATLHPGLPLPCM